MARLLHTYPTTMSKRDRRELVERRSMAAESAEAEHGVIEQAAEGANREHTPWLP